MERNEFRKVLGNINEWLLVFYILIFILTLGFDMKEYYFSIDLELAPTENYSHKKTEDPSY
jgi:hypothetical protein